MTMADAPDVGGTGYQAADTDAPPVLAGPDWTAEVAAYGGPSNLSAVIPAGDPSRSPEAAA
jgi:hypothetical protein